MGVTAIAPDRALIVWEPSATAPPGYIKANGATISRTAYAWLFARIGVTFGAGDGSTTFQIPDLRGEFLRGLDDGRGVDAARVLGSAQSSQNLSHTHNANLTAIDNGTLGAWGYYNYGGSAAAILAIPSSGGAEARPRNIAGLYCIAYAP